MNRPKARFNTYDKFTLPAGRLFNKTDIETTVGRFIFNLATLPEKYLKKYGYYNDTLTKSALGKFESKLGDMLLNDELTTKEFAEYTDRCEWLSMTVVLFLAPALNFQVINPIPEVIAKRDELFNKYDDLIKKGDNAVAEKIESEVLALADKHIKEHNSEAYDYYTSGLGSFSNNYKKSSVMAGAIENPYTKKLDILKSNYTDGVSPEDVSKFANLTIIGGYARGVATQFGGYLRKKMDMFGQSIARGEPGSDCGTKQTIKITIQDDLKGLFVNRYIVENGQLVLLTDENIKNYVNKEVNLRSPMCCKGECLCNKCLGELPYKLQIQNIGFMNSAMASVLMNASMKKIHDASIKFTKIKIENYIRER